MLECIISFNFYFSKFIYTYVCTMLQCRRYIFLHVTIIKVWRTDLGQYNMLLLLKKKLTVAHSIKLYCLHHLFYCWSSCLKKTACLSPLRHLQCIAYPHNSQSHSPWKVPETLSESLQIQNYFVIRLGHWLAFHCAAMCTGGAEAEPAKLLGPWHPPRQRRQTVVRDSAVRLRLLLKCLFHLTKTLRKQ